MNAPNLDPETSRHEALSRIAKCFAAAGIEDPRREARMLLLRALRIDLSALLADSTRSLGPVATLLTGFALRRARREPLSRVFGTRDFYGLTFGLHAETLDPRPETEGLVDAILADLRGRGGLAQPWRILDLGSGTGAIIIALLAHLPEAMGVAVDLAPGAVETTRFNARVHGVDARLNSSQSDLFEHVSGQYDVIVSNPPYIPHADLAGLMPEVRLFDPALALDGGSDGLDMYRRIAAVAPGHLAEHGLLALEIGLGQSESVMALLEAGGLDVPDILPDLAGIPRVVLAKRPCPDGSSRPAIR